MISKILVPTDFSDYANSACSVAIKLAKKTRAEVHFFHMDKLPEEWINQEVVDPSIAAHVSEVNRKLDGYVDDARHLEPAPRVDPGGHVEVEIPAPRPDPGDPDRPVG